MSASRRRSRNFRSAAIAAHPSLNIVINNAGVALLGAFNEVDQAQMEWLININFWGVVHGTRAFLPHLAKQREAHIVNLSSIFGIIAPPGQTAYCAAKFAVRGFSESLRHELAMANSPVKLSVVHPGGVLTNIVRNSRTGTGITDNARRAESIDRFDAVARTTPPAAAQRIITGIEKNQPRILIGNDARIDGSAAAVSPGDLLGGAGEADREDGGRRRGSEVSEIDSRRPGERRYLYPGGCHDGGLLTPQPTSSRGAWVSSPRACDRWDDPALRAPLPPYETDESFYRSASRSAKYPIVLR